MEEWQGAAVLGTEQAHSQSASQIDCSLVWVHVKMSQNSSSPSVLLG